MKNSKHIYFYSAGAILLSLGAYFVITRKNNDNGSQGNEVTVDEAKLIETPTGDTVLNTQLSIPENLAKVFELPITSAVKQLGNKNVYTKLAGVNARTSADVNNGVLTNSYGTIEKQATLIGKVTAIAEDNNKSKNLQGRTYKWIKVTLSPDAINSINANRTGFLQKKLETSFPYSAYVREDTIMLK